MRSTKTHGAIYTLDAHPLSPTAICMVRPGHLLSSPRPSQAPGEPYQKGPVPAACCFLPMHQPTPVPLHHRCNSLSARWIQARKTLGLGCPKQEFQSPLGRERTQRTTKNNVFGGEGKWLNWNTQPTGGQLASRFKTRSAHPDPKISRGWRVASETETEG